MSAAEDTWTIPDPKRRSGEIASIHSELVSLCMTGDSDGEANPTTGGSPNGGWLPLKPLIEIVFQYLTAPDWLSLTLRWSGARAGKQTVRVEGMA